MSCPCGSQATFATCCEPYLTGKKIAATPEILMRSRYSAYVKGNIDYIEKTQSDNSDFNKAEAETWASESEWLGLEIKNAKGNVVEFIAKYKVKGQDKVCIHQEISEFTQENGKWLFKQGTIVGAQPIRRTEAKVGRNDPCPCGSGKKYKKCCVA